MSSRETQRLILDSALRLFNHHGSPNVSTNRIAEDCGISKGNLNYHFRTKQEIILTLFWQWSQESLADPGWDEAQGTEDQFIGLFARQLAHSWRYRFFIREAAALLREQTVLRRRFGELRRRTAGEWRRGLTALAATGGLRYVPDEPEMELLVSAILVQCDHWLHFVETQDEEIDENAFLHGFEMLLMLLRTFLSDMGRAKLAQTDRLDAAARKFVAQITPPPVLCRQRLQMQPQIQAQPQAV